MQPTIHARDIQAAGGLDKYLEREARRNAPGSRGPSRGESAPGPTPQTRREAAKNRNGEGTGKAKPLRRHPRRCEGMNKGEAAYAAHLDALKAAGEVLHWQYEGVKLRLGDNCHLTPDFLVVTPECVELHDVKGRKGEGPWIEEDAKVKLKAAAEMHAWARHVVVWPRKGGGWERLEIG